MPVNDEPVCKTGIQTGIPSPTSAQPSIGAPVTDGELDNLFAPLQRYATVGLAVSGGGDSLALLHLFARWTELARPAIRVCLVLTVDHGLRPESAAEARFVADEARGLGLPHETLVWDDDKPTTGLPAAARDARYRLMGERLTRKSQPAALVAAHTLDDQAETFLMRLARGSGVDGLAGMAERTAHPDFPELIIVRPLLAVPGSRLRATLRYLGRTWIEDPTNADLDHERPRIRAALPLLSAAGLTNAGLARSAVRIARARDALVWATTALAASAIAETPGLFVTIDALAFEAAPVELQIRLLQRLLARYGGQHPPARLSELERLVDQFARTGNRMANPSENRVWDGQAATLGGCRIVAWHPRDVADSGTRHAAQDRPSIVVFREVGRGLPQLVLAPGEQAIWDRRFRVRLAPDAVAPAVVRPPSAAELSFLRANAAKLPAWPATLTSEIAATMPVFAFKTPSLDIGDGGLSALIAPLWPGSNQPDLAASCTVEAVVAPLAPADTG